MGQVAKSATASMKRSRTSDDEIAVKKSKTAEPELETTKIADAEADNSVGNNGVPNKEESKEVRDEGKTYEDTKESNEEAKESKAEAKEEANKEDSVIKGDKVSAEKGEETEKTQETKEEDRESAEETEQAPATTEDSKSGDKEVEETKSEPKEKSSTGFSSFSSFSAFSKGGFGQFATAAAKPSNPWNEPKPANPWAEKKEDITDETKKEERNPGEEKPEQQDAFAQVTLAKQDLKTGEEDEATIYSLRTRLYAVDGEAKAWKERGVGVLKLNRFTGDRKYRLIMRLDGVLRVSLNLPLFKSMQVTKGFTNSLHTERFVRFSGIEDGEARQYAVRCASEEARDGLYSAITDAIDAIE